MRNTIQKENGILRAVPITFVHCYIASAIDRGYDPPNDSGIARKIYWTD